MVEQCIILHQKTHNKLQSDYNNWRKNNPDVKTFKSFQVSEQGFSLIVFYEVEEKEK